MAGRKYPPARERLEARLVLSSTGCLDFKSESSSGRAQIKVNGKLVYVHRFAWELAHGPVPVGLEVLHHCDGTLCCQTRPTIGYPNGHLFLGTRPDRRSRAVTERLEAWLVDQPNGCREFDGTRTKFGYGQIGVGGKMVLAHRLAWELANGPIPDGLCVLHHCDNPPCCQTEPTPGYPDGHLFLGTNADNSADRDAKGRHGQSNKTHCPQGHPYDAANTYVFVTKSGFGRACRICQAEASARYRAGRLFV